jgi:hypothetical protein
MGMADEGLGVGCTQIEYRNMARSQGDKEDMFEAEMREVPEKVSFKRRLCSVAFVDPDQ